MGRLEQQFRETINRRNAIAPEIARLGELRSRLLANNIELDQKAALLTEQINTLETRVNAMASQDAAMREALRAGEDELKVLRANGAGEPGTALADRSRPRPQAGRVEIPR